MAVTSAFTISNTVVTVNGRQITDWGADGSGISEEAINPKRRLLQGQGGNALILERIAPGRRVTIKVRSGSADSAFLHGLYASGAIITYTRSQVGALETAIGTEGIILSEEAVSRVNVDSISDDTFVMEFNLWDSVKGGES